MKTKIVFCVACESDESGAVDWFPDQPAAQAKFDKDVADKNLRDHTVTRFNLSVPKLATSKAITKLVDEAMWDFNYTVLQQRKVELSAVA
jgi:hypothetical protein